jgi:DNA-binding NtrC family response regulator
LGQFAKTYQREKLRISEEAMQRLENWNWPGNVRELRNLLESVVVMLSGEVITVADLPEQLRRFDGQNLVGTSIAPTSMNLQSMKEIEEFAILNTLRSEGGNRTKAAQILGLSVRTLQRKIKEYGIEL